MVELFVGLVVTMDQCVLMIRRNGLKILLGLMLLSSFDSPETWRIVWQSAALVFMFTLLRVMGALEEVGRGRRIYTNVFMRSPSS